MFHLCFLNYALLLIAIAIIAKKFSRLTQKLGTFAICKHDICTMNAMTDNIPN